MPRTQTRTHTMYLPTVNVNDVVIEQLRSGLITLRPGQWIRLTYLCPEARRARYVGITDDGIFVVQHFEGNYCPDKFIALVDYWRGSEGGEA